MKAIRRRWTSEDAEEWTREDWIAVIISPLVYLFLMLGVVLSILLVPAGFVLLAAGIVLLVVLVFVIDPKLAAISQRYERQQKEYIDALERKVKWED
jgi:vacuolar-type H+-ATPase subunit I/STV1